MIPADAFEVLSVKAVAFTSADPTFGTAAIVSQIWSNLKSRYDGSIETTPELPSSFKIFNAEIVAVPSVKLTSKDKHWTFEATPIKVDSIWQRLEDPTTSDLSQICRECLLPILSYPVDSDSQIVRLGLVVQRFQQHADNAQTIAESFCKPSLVDASRETAPFRNSRTFELHNLKRFLWKDDIEVNSWVRCMSKSRTTGAQGIAIEQDINTPSENSESRSFEREEIEQFFNWAAEKMEQILGLYFPKGNEHGATHT